MNKFEELNDNLKQVKQSIKLIEDTIKSLEKEEKKEEVITYTIGDLVKNKDNIICMLVQSHFKNIVLINLANGNRYYDSYYKANVLNVDNISEKEFNSICNNKGNCWSKVEFRFNWG